MKEAPEGRMKGRQRLVNLRVSEAEHDRWKLVCGGNVSGWLRDLANAACLDPAQATLEEELGRPPAEAMQPVERLGTRADDSGGLPSSNLAP